MCAIGSKLLLVRMLGSQSAPLVAKRGLLVSTRAVVQHITLHSSAGRPDTQHTFDGPGSSCFLGDPRRVLSWSLASASYCVTPLQCSLLYLPFPDCSSCSCWRAERQECANKPCVLCHAFPWGGSQSRLTSAFIPVHLKACNWPSYPS